MADMSELPGLYAAEVDKEMIAQAEAGVKLARVAVQRAGVHGAQETLRQAEAARERLVLAQVYNNAPAPITMPQIVKLGQAVADAEHYLHHCRAVAVLLEPRIPEAEANLQAAIAQAHRPVLRLAIARRIEAAAAADKAAAGGDAAQAKAAAAEADRIFAETWAAMDFISERHGAEMPVPLSRVPSRYSGQSAAVCSEAAERAMWGHLAPARR